MPALKRFLDGKLREIRIVLLVPVAVAAVAVTAVVLTYGAFWTVDLIDAFPVILDVLGILVGLLCLIAFLPVALVCLALTAAGYGSDALGAGILVLPLILAWLLGNLLHLAVARPANRSPRVRHRLLTFWGRQLLWTARFLCYAPPLALLGLLLALGVGALLP